VWAAQRPSTQAALNSTGHAPHEPFSGAAQAD
jgi:hypothetical protein